MISSFRSFAKSKWAAGLLVLLALALLVTGGSRMGDVLSVLGPKHIISAGERSVDAAQFRADLDKIREDQQQRAGGQSISMADLVADGRLVGYLTDQSQKLGFLAWADKVGVRPGQELVLRQIRQIPDFFDSVTGRFDQAKYEETLQRNNMTPEMFVHEVRDSITARHFVAGAGAGMRMPRIYGAVLANQAAETRDGRWFMVTQAMAGTAPAPTEAQLNTFMQQNATRLRQPEFRRATVALFDSPNDGQGEITDARVQERFNFRRDALSQPETRTFVTLTAPNKATADRIAAALRAGQTPEAVGQANNLQPTPFADRPRSAVTDPAIAGAVFGLQVNQVSDPVQARVGFVVAKVSEIKPGHPATLDDVRAQIIQELRQEDARAAVFARVTAYDKARQDGKTFEAAIAEVGARVIHLPPVTREGRSPVNPNFRAPPQLLEAMWKLGKNGESEVNEAGENGYFVVRVDEITPPALPSLSDPRVREELARAWVGRENARLLSAKANALAARVRGGEDVAAVARSAGAELVTGTSVNGQDQSRGQGVINGLFTTPRNEVFSLQQSADSFVIGRTDRITAPNATLVADSAEQYRSRISEDNLGSVGQSAVKAAAASVRASYDEALARTALDLPAADAPAAPAGGAAPAQ